MPTDHDQGTGKHGHKDSQEPYPHTRDHEGKSASSGSHATQSHSQGSQSHSGQTHSAQSHSGQSHSGQSHSGSSSGTHSAQSRDGSGGSEDASLKSREYRDENGEVHHHTKTFMDQHHNK